MTYKLTIHQKPTYLHVVVSGRNTRENVKAYVAEMIRECTARNCFRVLIEEHLEGPRLEMEDVFDIASEGSKIIGGLLKVIAYVDVNAKGDLMQFAENVAVNRGLPMAVFPTVAAAENWLLNQDRGGTQPRSAADADKPRR